MIFLSKENGIIDTHEHYQKGGNISLFFSIMKDLGISKVLFVPTGSSPKNRGHKVNTIELLKLQEKFPEKIIAFCTIYEKDPGAFEFFKKCIKKGAKGLKLIGGHPHYYKPGLLANRNLYKVLELAKIFQLPILVHVSPIRLPQAEKEFKIILKKYPEITFIWAHFCSCIYQDIYLKKCQYYLNKYSNLYTDISMGGGIKRYFKHLETINGAKIIRDFIIKYQDRILWGSDIILSSKKSQTRAWLRERIGTDFKIHRERFFKSKFAQNPDSLINGLFLPKRVLRKIYIENPKKILRLK